MFINIIIAVVILAALILIHEIGHFVAARFFGMRVNEFGIGFPPRLWGRKKGDTLYSINVIIDPSLNNHKDWIKTKAEFNYYSIILESYLQKKEKG